MLSIVALVTLLQAASPPNGAFAKPPVPRPPRYLYVSEADYPNEARKAGIEGSVSIRYHVGINGRVESCTVTSSSNDAGLDERTCGIAQRARFQPARDASDQKVAADQSLTIVWRIANPCPIDLGDAICVRLD
jgi:periplasmic protein TonB